jgi:hypothetical protein
MNYGRGLMVFFKSPRHELDPLDVEILQRAFEVTWAAIKASGQSFDFESDEELEAALHREPDRDCFASMA